MARKKTFKKLKDFTKEDIDDHLEKVFQRQHKMMSQGLRRVKHFSKKASPEVIAKYEAMLKCMEDAVAAYEA